MEKIIPNGTPVIVKGIEQGHYAEVVGNYIDQDSGQVRYEIEIHGYFGDVKKGCGYKRSDLTED